MRQQQDITSSVYVENVFGLPSKIGENEVVLLLCKTKFDLNALL